MDKELKKKLSNLSEQEIEKLMWNAEMAIEARCEWCLNLNKTFCEVFGREVNPKANRFCARYSPE